MNDEAQPLLTHLIELRSRLLKIVVVFLIVFFALVPFAQKIYAFVAAPLIDAMPIGSSMIAIDVIAPFFVPIKVTLVVAFLATLPHTLYQIWAFIAPALYSHEKRLALPLVISSVILFFIGMSFAYFLVFPVVFHFINAVTPEGVNMATDIDKYFSFILGMFLAFGVTFEVPVVVILLHKAGILSIEQMTTARPYIIVGAFAIAAVVTPPDVISQCLLAIPLWLLYEAGLFICKLSKKKTTTQ
ncbi:twin-arginine translocase subunit TatC [Neisseria sp. Ec49-e6-T10]|uniref:twin-arginine translocase subunit TatC n=1 Tax=Neisseria sp. Ec49-e6-T10 TaxID=3140744 RepID=UPI003EC060F0